MLKAPNTSQAKGAGGIMSQARRIISVAALHDFVGQLFKARGMAAKAADQIADLILYAELSSIASHGGVIWTPRRAHRLPLFWVHA